MGFRLYSVMVLFIAQNSTIHMLFKCCRINLYVYYAQKWENKNISVDLTQELRTATSTLTIMNA